MFNDISKTISFFIDSEMNETKLSFNPQICSVNFLTLVFISSSSSFEVVGVVLDNGFVIVEVVEAVGVVLKLKADKEEGLSEFC